MYKLPKLVTKFSPLAMADLDTQVNFMVMFHRRTFKVFQDGLSDDLTSKNISSCNVSYTVLPMKTDLHFQPTLP